MLDRPLHRAAVRLFGTCHENHLRRRAGQCPQNLGHPRLVGPAAEPRRLHGNYSRCPSTKRWKIGSRKCPAKGDDSALVVELVESLRNCIEGSVGPDGRVGRVPRVPPPAEVANSGGTRFTRPTLLTPSPSLTYDRTARRSYEKAYWQTIAKLATGRFKNKDNADCVFDRKDPRAAGPPPSRPGGPGRLPPGPLRKGDQVGRHGRAKCRWASFLSDGRPTSTFPGPAVGSGTRRERPTSGTS